jgi:hypothetical protein
MASPSPNIDLWNFKYLSGLQDRQVNWKNELIGWMTAFFMALSKWHIFFSTTARGYLVIMMLGQIYFVKILGRLQEDPRPTQYNSGQVNILINLVGWLLIWTLETWTLPTFIFFELSLAIIFGYHYFRKSCNKNF